MDYFKLGCWVSLYLGYSANEVIGIILDLQTFHPTAPSGLLGYECQPYFLASIMSMVYFTFLFNIYIIHKTLN